MSIRIGSPAPDVATDAWVRDDDQAIRISPAHYIGQWVVLFFYPRDFTFICPTELQAFADLQLEFDREDAVVLAASTDSYWCHKAWFETERGLSDVAYPVLADTSHRLAKRFGVLGADGAALRATFLIDPQGIVRHLLVNDLDVGRNPEETLRTLRAFKTGELCPVSWRPGQRTLSARTEKAA